MLEKTEGLWSMVQAGITEGARKSYKIGEEELEIWNQDPSGIVVEIGHGENTESHWYCGTMGMEPHCRFRKGNLECDLEDCVFLLNSGGGYHIVSSESDAS